MPRSPIEDDPRYIDLHRHVHDVEQTTAKEIDDLKNRLKMLEGKMSFEKSLAIIQAAKSGLSIYAIAKAVGIKSSTKKATLISDCQNVISEYYGKDK
jgi:hypothetical protein